MSYCPLYRAWLGTRLRSPWSSHSVWEASSLIQSVCFLSPNVSAIARTPSGLAGSKPLKLVTSVPKPFRTQQTQTVLILFKSLGRQDSAISQGSHLNLYH